PGRPGRRRGSPPGEPGPADHGRSQRPARPPARRGAAGQRASGGERDHRAVRAAAAGAQRRRGPRRRPAGLPAGGDRGRAARLLKPERDPIDLAEPPPGTTAEDLRTRASAQAWFTAEHRVLLACINASAAAGLDRHVWQLAWTVKTYLYRGGYWHEQMQTEHAAADAARRDGDLRGLGQALFSLAEACERLNRLEEAESHYRAAMEAYSAAGDLSGEAD